MPIRIAVTGRHGQVVRALIEAASWQDMEVIPLGRPELDLGCLERLTVDQPK